MKSYPIYLCDLKLAEAGKHDASVILCWGYVEAENLGEAWMKCQTYRTLGRCEPDQDVFDSTGMMLMAGVPQRKLCRY